MKTSIEDFLQKLDFMFKDKSSKDIYMTFFMVFALIFTFSYLLFWESAEKEFQQKLVQIDDISLKIQTDKIFLQHNSQNKIIRLDNEIKTINIKLKNYKKNNEYIKEKIEGISPLIYNERTWGEYLHSISINAKKYDMHILNFSSKNVDANNSFGHMLDINVKATGGFHDTLNFINSLEQSSLVVDIHDLSIDAKEKIVSDLNLSVWGILY